MRHLVFLLLLLVTAGWVNAQDFSNKGKEFWIAYGNHVRMMSAVTMQNPAEKMQLYLTSDVSTTGKVEIAGINFSQNFTVTANQITTVDIPRTAALLDEGTYQLGIHVIAEKPIVAYSFIYVNSISGATLCLPVSTLGKSYYSVNYTQVANEANCSSFFDVIATDTGTTTVEIIPSAQTKTGKPAGAAYTVNLKQGEVYQVLGRLTSTSGPAFTGVDLTGTQIRSIATAASKCKKIAVFSGSAKISIGCTQYRTADNLYQQMYPVTTWGKTYITVPSINNASTANQRNYYRIFQSSVTGVVRLNGNVIPAASFINGQYYDFDNTQANFVESDQPILVAQYFATQSCNNTPGLGDPEMIYLNPVEQTIKSVTLNSMRPTTGTGINEHHINVVLRNDPSIISSFKIDGASPGTFRPLATNPLYSYGQFTVIQGAHTMTCDSGFNAIAYGFGTNESYGYSAGTNLKDLYQFVNIVNEYATVSFPAACRNSPFEFSMTFPYMVTKLTWQFKNLFADTVDQRPSFDSTWVVNGRTLYRYKLRKKYVIPTLGTYPITILAENLTGDDCSGLQEINYDLQVFERPKAGFRYTTTGCLSDPVAFFDSTDAIGRSLTRFQWSFGDGGASGAKDPTHLYPSAGTFTVKYSSISDIGCVSDTTQKLISFTEMPLPKFSSAQAYCERQLVTFVNQSVPAAANVKTWGWDFGDGGKSTLTTPTHTYTTAGNYTVALAMETTSGCKATFTQAVKVNINPRPNFSLPQICFTDPQAVFNDSTSIADNSGNFTYLWDFGDSRSTAANPNTSTAKNGSHAYTASGNYQVKLQATSAAGCKADTTRTLIVNGAVPRAAFDLANVAALCSNLPVTLTDRSTVDFGKVTKVEMYWEYNTDPLQKTVDSTPLTGKTYSHTYTEFGQPATKSAQLVYIAYSGITCMQQVSRTVDLLATPQFVFDSIRAVCAELDAFQLLLPTQNGAVTGTGSFSGTGVTASGIFSPSVAKAGTHAIVYRLAGTNGCATSKTRYIKVNPTPLADAGPDRTVLEGGSLTLAAQAAASSTVLWTPARFLDNATTLAPHVTPTEDIKYSLRVTSIDGCTATDEMSVTILKSIKVPNAFSPNGDGINDTWKIQYLESYPGATIQVFNRYGQTVFTSSGYSREWNGTINGNALPTGTYYWIIDPKNGRSAINGSVTIIR